MGRVRRAAAAFAGLLLAGGAGPAAADLRVCNRTTQLLNVALGRAAAESFRSEGWWAIGPDSCQPVVRGGLDSRWVYLYVADVNGRSVVPGTDEMCIVRQAFEIDGLGDCWRRGYEAADFVEIDTRDFDAWTVVIEEDGRVTGETP